MFSKRKSKDLALSIAEKFNGRVERIFASFSAFTTCRYCVKFNYRDMRIELYPFCPFCQIWVQNFRFPKNISFSIGSKLPTLGLTQRLKDPFRDYHIPVFGHEAYDIEAAIAFCKILENEINIKKLGMSRKEYLIMSSGQILMHNKNRGQEYIEKRIDILGDLFDRNDQQGVRRSDA